MALEITLGPGRPVSDEPIVGIDLGTTNSLVAWVDQGIPRILKTPQGQTLLPSVVTLLEGETVIGDRARARRTREEQVISSVKRLLGRKWVDVRAVADRLPYRLLPDAESGEIRIQLGERTFTAVELSAMILRELRRVAEAALGRAVRKAVITVPAYFNDAQRQATRAAGRIAGLDVLRIINEPTAAALAYGLDKKRQGLIAVYDLGGGTFDVSILKLRDGIFEVLATHGDTQLGGDDLDRAIAREIEADVSREWGVDLSGESTESLEVRAALIEGAERAKIALSQSTQTELRVSWRERVFTRPLSRSELTALILPLLERTREPCLKALADAGLRAEQLSDVVLVGGPTRLAAVQETARSIFGREPNTSVHPDEVVALGAAIQADILAGNNREVLLLDVVPLTLGIETYGGVMSPLISRNSRIPAVARETYTTFVDNQTGVDVHVLQGERDRAEDNRSLARFKLAGIAPQPAGMPRIEVTFLVDADGILNVSARDLKTGREQSVEVRPTFGITDAEVERMLLEGQENAEQDIAYRRLVDARNDAEPILRGAERNWEAAQRLLPPEEAEEIKGSIEGLRRAIGIQDPAQFPQLREASLRLKQSTRRLAELLIKEKISSSGRE